MAKLREQTQMVSEADINKLLITDNFEYERPEGIVLTKEVVLTLVLFATTIFCCGVCLSYCLVSAYRSRKKVLNENIEAWELGDNYGVEGNGGQILDFYGNSQDMNSREGDDDE